MRYQIVETNGNLSSIHNFVSMRDAVRTAKRLREEGKASPAYIQRISDGKRFGIHKRTALNEVLPHVTSVAKVTNRLSDKAPPVVHMSIKRHANEIARRQRAVDMAKQNRTNLATRP